MMTAVRVITYGADQIKEKLLSPRPRSYVVYLSKNMSKNIVFLVEIIVSKLISKLSYVYISIILVDNMVPNVKHYIYAN